MGKNIKYVFAAFMAASLVLPGISSAQSVASLRMQIQILLQQVQQLQAQLATQQGTSSGSTGGGTGTGTAAAGSPCYVFSTDLTFGAMGAEVTELQTALQKDGEQVKITGVYDNQTAVAVTVFQQKYASTVLAPNGLTSGTGYTGAATRAQLNLLDGCSTSQTAAGTGTGHQYSATPGPTTVTNVWPWPVTVTSPAAGATLAPGENTTITWTTMPTNMETITLLQNGAAVATIGIPPGVSGGNSGITQAYPWTVPTNLSGSGFQIQVQASGLDNGTALSGAFNIGIAPPTQAPAPSPVQGTATSTPTAPATTTVAVNGGSLTAAQYGSASSFIAPGTTQAVIGQYMLSASMTEQVKITAVEVQAGSSYFQNFKVLLNGVPFGTTQGTVTNSSLYIFSGNPVTIPAGGSVSLRVVADIASSAAGSASPATNLVGAIGSGVTTGAAIVSNGIAGQSVAFGAAGQPGALSVSLDGSSPAASQLMMGSTRNALAAYRFTNTSNTEDVTVTDVQIMDTTGAGKASFSNVGLWNGNTLLGTAGSAQSVSGGYLYTFHFATPVAVPQANSVVLTLKADVPSFSSQGVTDNSTHVFQISQATALGASSNIAVAPALLSPTGNAMTVLRTTLVPRAATLGAVSNRTPSPVDNLATISFVANPAGAAQLSALTLTFSGSAVNSAFVNGVKLRDANNNDVTVADGASAAMGACSAQACAKTWTFANGANAFVISGGSSYTFVLLADDTLIPVLAGGVSPTVGVTIQSAGDIKYADGPDAAAVQNIPLPATMVPLNVTAVAFAPNTISATGGTSLPTASVSVTPQSITLGQSVTFSWSSTGATSCAGSRGGTYAASGSFVTTPPALPYTYGMTCTGPGGTSAPATMTVMASTVTPTPVPTPAPAITLSASPSTITQGQSVTLTWSSTNAASCSLNTGAPGFSGASGSQSVTPSVSGSITYTMTCTGAGGSASRSVTVNVNAPVSATPPPAPPTVTLSASPSTITAGQSVTLSWTSANAASCALTSGASGFSATAGSQSVTPPATPGSYPYTMQCTNASGVSSAPSSVTVTVNAVPVPAPTVNVSANPAAINQGQSATITWAATNATSCSMNPGGSSLAANGSQTVAPSSPGVVTYTMTCTGPGGSASGYANVTVNAVLQPTINISSHYSAINEGQSIVLSWSSTNASTCSTSGNNWNNTAVATSGSAVITPSGIGTYPSNVTYTMTCTGPGGSASSYATFVVLAPVPPVPTVTFSASPTTISLGQSVTLAWISTDTTGCSLYPAGVNVATSGVQSVTPTSAGTVSYTIACTGPDGNTSGYATVTVNAIPAPTVTLAAAQTSLSSGQSTTLTWTVSGSATSCSANFGGGSVSTTGGSASVTAPSAGSVVYTINCTGPGGTSAPASVTLTVNVGIPTVTLTANPSTIAQGQLVTFSWTIVGTVDSCAGSVSNVVPVNGVVPSTGSITFAPSVSGPWTLTCYYHTSSGVTTPTNTASVTVTITSPTGLKNSTQASQLADMLASMQALLNQISQSLGASGR